MGVSVTTLRRWDRDGKLVPEHIFGGHRRYDLVKMFPEQFWATSDVARKTVAYARVSNHDQKEDLDRQKQVLEEAKHMEVVMMNQGEDTTFEDDLEGHKLNILRPRLCM